jgi:hypothetical protein
MVLIGVLLGWLVEETPDQTQPPLTTLPPETAAPHFSESPIPTNTTNNLNRYGEKPVGTDVWE